MLTALLREAGSKMFWTRQFAGRMILRSAQGAAVLQKLILFHGWTVRENMEARYERIRKYQLKDMVA